MIDSKKAGLRAANARLRDVGALLTRFGDDPISQRLRWSSRLHLGSLGNFRCTRRLFSDPFGFLLAALHPSHPVHLVQEQISGTVADFGKGRPAQNFLQALELGHDLFVSGK